jgi:Ca-activated chloride channel homolog
MKAVLPVLLLLLVVFTSSARAAQKDIEKTLNVSVDVVLVNVTVTDEKNEVVTGLEASDFRLFEDKTEQTIQYFSTETAPISLGIIFDISSSMDEASELARTAALTFLKNSTEEDEYFLLPFNSDARIAHDFTPDITRIETRLRGLPSGGATALYDALYLGVSHVRKGLNGKKALLLITDGEDNKSRYSRSNIRESIKEADVQIYAVDLGLSFVKEFAELSGGQAYRTSPDNVWETCRKIAAQLKNQYVLGFVSSNTSDQSWRNIQVRLARPSDKNLTVRARKGYYAR